MPTTSSMELLSELKMTMKPTRPVELQAMPFQSEQQSVLGSQEERKEESPKECLMRRSVSRSPLSQVAFAAMAIGGKNTIIRRANAVVVIMRRREAMDVT